MRPMLSGVLLPGFSKTARSCPAHREAVWHSKEVAPCLVVRGRLADDVAKRAAESSKAPEPDVKADVGHGAVGLPQQEHGALDPPALQVAVRRLTKGRPEGPDEMRLGNVRKLREVGYVERPRVGAVDGVAGPEHAAVGLLDGAAHRILKLRRLSRAIGGRNQRCEMVTITLPFL